MDCPSPSSKILASPTITSTKTSKFSPLSGLLKNSPKLKPTRSMRHVLDPESGKTARPSTLKPKEEDKDMAATQKQVKPEFGSRSLIPKHKPILEETTASALILSPSFNPESVRLLASEDHKDKKIVETAPGVLTFCDCGQLSEPGLTQCSKCKAKSTIQEYAGYLYELSKKNAGELNRFWFSLLGKELYRN